MAKPFSSRSLGFNLRFQIHAVGGRISDSSFNTSNRLTFSLFRDSNSSGQAGQSPSALAGPATVAGGLIANAIAVGGTHSCAVGTVAAAPGVYCWGDRSSGQLGDGLTSPNVAVPALASQLAPVAGTADRLLAGRAHTCAARGASGEVSCAGADLSLQAGLSPPAATVLKGPVISLGAPVVGLFGGEDRGCALTPGVTPGAAVLSCWGANDRGQLGDGSALPTATPVHPRPF